MMKLKNIVKRFSFFVLLFCFAFSGTVLFSGCSSYDVKVSGSSSVTPLMEKLALKYEEYYERENGKKINIAVIEHDSTTGIAETKSFKNDIGLASRNLKNNEREGLIETKFCGDGIALIVNVGFQGLDDGVTGGMVYDLYKEGIPMENITQGISREAGSGTRDAFDSLIKKNGESLSNVREYSRVIKSVNGTGTVKTSVTSNSGKNTVGYVSMGSLDGTVKTLKFEGVEPTPENVKNETYKLARPFMMITRKDDVGKKARDFIEWILSGDDGKGQSVVKAEKYVEI